MILGIGTDLIEIERIEKAFEKHGMPFFEKLFTLKEILYCQKYAQPLPHFAGRFAAKEAVAKALGTGFTALVQWHDFEILNDEAGKPYVTFSPKLQESFPKLEIHLSISHSKHYAVATALATGKQAHPL